MSKIKIKNLNDDNLKKLAVDLRAGKIFTDRDVSPPDAIGMVFMPIVFMEMPKKEAEQVGLIYEYLDKAGPRSINGMPIFPSCRLLSKEDLTILCEYMKKLEQAERGVLERVK